MEITEYFLGIEEGERGWVSSATKEQTVCGAKIGNYTCTRSAGHELPHAAHGRDDSIVATWK